MDKFQQQAHEKRKNLLKKCNELIRGFNLKIFNFPIDSFTDAPNAGMFTDPHKEKYFGIAEDIMYEQFTYYLREMISWLQEEWLWLPKKALDIGVVKEQRITENRFLLIGSREDLSIYDEKYFKPQNFDSGFKGDGDFCLDWDCLPFSVKFILEELNRFKDWIKTNRDRRAKKFCINIMK